MNTLQKCIDELKKDSPDIRYILGMLETYLELSAEKSVSSIIPMPPHLHRNAVPVLGLADEEQLPPGYASGPIGRIA